MDALLDMVARVRTDAARKSRLAEFDFIDPSKRLILVAGHRRNNFGTSFENICQALPHPAERDDVQILYPVHLNPNAQESADHQLWRGTRKLRCANRLLPGTRSPRPCRP